MVLLVEKYSVVVVRDVSLRKGFWHTLKFIDFLKIEYCTTLEKCHQHSKENSSFKFGIKSCAVKYGTLS
jgi:hypothetical protein